MDRTNTWNSHLEKNKLCFWKFPTKSWQDYLQSTYSEERMYCLSWADIYKNAERD